MFFLRMQDGSNGVGVGGGGHMIYFYGEMWKIIP